MTDRSIEDIINEAKNDLAFRRDLHSSRSGVKLDILEGLLEHIEEQRKKIERLETQVDNQEPKF